MTLHSGILLLLYIPATLELLNYQRQTTGILQLCPLVAELPFSQGFPSILSPSAVAPHFVLFTASSHISPQAAGKLEF